MSELSVALNEAIWSELCKLNTAMPGVVNSYDPATVSAVIQPLLKKRYLSGDAVGFKPITDVPVMFMRTKRFRCTFPLERGDTGLLLFGQRSLADWLTKDGTEVTPQDGRKFALTDAIFVPGLFAFKQGSLPDDGSQFELAFDEVKVTSDGKDLDVSTSGQVNLNGSSEAMVKEGPLKDALATLVTDLAMFTAADFGAAFQAQFLTDLQSLQTNIAQLASTKNKLG